MRNPKAKYLTEKGHGLLVFSCFAIIATILVLALTLQEQSLLDKYFENEKNTNRIKNNEHRNRSVTDFSLEPSHTGSKELTSLIDHEANDKESQSHAQQNTIWWVKLLSFLNQIANPIVALFTILTVVFAWRAWVTARADSRASAKANALQLRPYLEITGFTGRQCGNVFPVLGENDMPSFGWGMKATVIIKNTGSTPAMNISTIFTHKGVVGITEGYGTDYRQFDAVINDIWSSDNLSSQYSIEIEYLEPGQTYNMTFFAARNPTILEINDDNESRFLAEGSIILADLLTGEKHLRRIRFRFDENDEIGRARILADDVLPLKKRKQKKNKTRPQG